MTWRPYTYQDHINEGGDNILNGSPDPGKPHRHFAACPCDPKPKLAILLVDCRHIDNAIVNQDWACNVCWTSWIREASKSENILRELVRQLETEPDEHKLFTLKGRELRVGKSVKDLRTIMSGRGGLKTSALKANLSSELKRSGFVVEHVRPHCFTKSQWIQMQGGPPELVARHKGARSDFS